MERKSFAAMRPCPAHVAIVLMLAIFALLTACDSGGTPAPAPTLQPTSDAARPTAVPTEATVATSTTENLPPTSTHNPDSRGLQVPSPTGSVVDAAVVTQQPTPNESAPSPTPVTATSTGADLTALEALAILKPKALAWQADARLGLLANTRPGQAKNLLGGALGDPNTNEATPGGKGRNWTLIAFSPGTNGAEAFSLDGTVVDLVQTGAVGNDVATRFTGADTAALGLQALNPSSLVDSDKIAEKAGERGKANDVGIALLSPNGLGLGPLPTPVSGGAAPVIAYELFSQSSGQQSFIIYNGTNGSVVLDSAAP